MSQEYKYMMYCQPTPDQLIPCWAGKCRPTLHSLGHWRLANQLLHRQTRSVGTLQAAI